MSIFEMNKENHDEFIKQGIVLVEFWAAWCGPCRIAGPIFDEASDRHTDATFASINIDNESELAASYKVKSIPTLMIFKNGRNIYSKAGVHDAANIDALVEQAKEFKLEL